MYVITPPKFVYLLKFNAKTLEKKNNKNTLRNKKESLVTARFDKNYILHSTHLFVFIYTRNRLLKTFRVFFLCFFLAHLYLTFTHGLKISVFNSVLRYMVVKNLMNIFISRREILLTRFFSLS